MQEGNGKGITVEKAVTINRPVGEVYAFWRDFANLPRFMPHLESVTARDDGLSHWVTKAPAGQQVEWDAEIITEMRDKVIAWRSIGAAAAPTAGYIHFEPEHAGQGTVVRGAAVGRYVRERRGPPAPAEVTRQDRRRRRYRNRSLRGIVPRQRCAGLVFTAAIKWLVARQVNSVQ